MKCFNISIIISTEAYERNKWSDSSSWVSYVAAFQSFTLACAWHIHGTGLCMLLLWSVGEKMLYQLNRNIFVATRKNCQERRGTVGLSILHVCVCVCSCIFFSLLLEHYPMLSFVMHCYRQCARKLNQRCSEMTQFAVPIGTKTKFEIGKEVSYSIVHVCGEVYVCTSKLHLQCCKRIIEKIYV